MNSIVFPAGELTSLRKDLLGHAPKEAAAILIAGRAAISRGTRLLIRESISAPSDSYTIQEGAKLELSPSFISPLLKRARKDGWSLIFVHTHPFHDNTRFSELDDAGERILMPTLLQRAAERPHGALVLGRSGFDARLWASPDRPTEVDELIEAGKTITLHKRVSPEPVVGPEQDRTIRALGADGQARLREFTIGVVGVGGVGSIVAEQLARLGIGRVILLDPDHLEASNLNRVAGAASADIGKAKVSVAADFLRRIRPDMDVKAFKGSLLIAKEAKPLLSAHVIMGCTDTQGSRAVLNQMAYQYLIPVVDTGMIIDASGGMVTAVAGRVQMLAPGLPCLVCQGTLNPEQVRRDLLTPEQRARDPYIMGAEEPQPAVVSLNGTIASLAVTMLLSAVTGFPYSDIRHQIYRGEQGVVRAISSTADPVCIICSLRGSLGRGDLWPMPWRT